ncbi:MAG: tRNA (adenosine(37)-N6)-threonylcarbamoyltransferase complex dimerization subunit type 1 TsaB [Akkermansiaceae bacterium]
MSDSLTSVEEKWSLAMETSVPQATLALACGSEIIARAEFTSERSQEVDLFGPLKEILANLPEGKALSALVIGTGPGSYNGARVGIAAGQAIAQVHGCGVAGICSFEAVPTLTWAAGDARRGSFYLMTIGGEPVLHEHADFLAQLAECEGEIGTFESVKKLNCPEGSVTQVTPTAEGLLKAWQLKSTEEKDALMAIPAEAFYIRPPHITISKKKSP